MINKNDCFDCGNCIPENLLNKKYRWICKVTKEPIQDKEIKDEECLNFEYEE